MNRYERSTQGGASDEPRAGFGANRHYPNFGDGLARTPFSKLPLGCVQARGWLAEQLQRAADGMTGRLDEWYDVVGPANAWRGGHGDNWERGPYWLDGLVPLAHLLHDDKLRAKAEPFIEWTLASRRRSGFFGPGSDVPRREKPGHQVHQYDPADWWPRMVMGKALITHYEATGDQRVIDLLSDYFRYQQKTLPRTRLDHYSWWAERRGGENEWLAYWLYQRTGEHFLLELGETLHQQTHDWSAVFREPGTLHGRHGVNVAMALKQPAIGFLRRGDRRQLACIDTALAHLDERYGQPTGMFESDELLDEGRRPTQGVETCAVVETMFSLETLVVLTGRVDYADRLERIAYNALPAATSPDYTMRQYYQQANQIAINKAIRFGTFHGDDLCFGLLSGYPCCTVNLHQGWPRFVEHLWLASHDEGLAVMTFGPSVVTATVGEGQVVRIEEETAYPFEETIRFTIHTSTPVRFPLHLRIPRWASSPGLALNGAALASPEPGSMARIDRSWSKGDTLILTLPAHVSLCRWHQDSVAVERGPLVYALPIAGDWQRLNEMSETAVWGKQRTGDFNFAVVSRDGLEPVEAVVDERGLASGAWPWQADQAPTQVTLDARVVEGWHANVDGSAGDPPPSPIAATGEPRRLSLIPYGATSLRVTELPWNEG